MFERPRSGERAILVHVEFGVGGHRQTREELSELVVSAGADPAEWVLAKRNAPDRRLFVGTGKAEEIRERVKAIGAEVVIFNHALSPAQERNLERLIQCRVLDRIGLILDIFAQRASTFEGKLQVELAQLRHISTRLVRGWTHLERQKGGIGLRGPGEKQIETDRRLVSDRIRQIEQRLERVSTRRELSRRNRSRAAVPVISLVGYTNAGKSTLFNRLTGAGVLVADRLFATLDPTLRRLSLDGGATVVIADTVGFISDLPHDLVAAFRSTLEETRRAHLLLHVIDAVEPGRRRRVDEVNAVLRDIGADDVPQVEVYTKIDARDDADAHCEYDETGRAQRVWVSSKTGEGLDLLRRTLAEYFAKDTVHRKVRLSPSSGRLRARLFELGEVVDEGPGDDGEWIMEVVIRSASLDHLCRREGLDRTRIAA